MEREGVTVSKLAKVFKLDSQEVFLSNDDNQLFWPNESGLFSLLDNREYYVNGDNAQSTLILTPLNSLTNRLNTSGMPAPLNLSRSVNGFASNTQTGFAGPSISFQRQNSCVPKEKPYKKTISRLQERGRELKIFQNVFK